MSWSEFASTLKALGILTSPKMARHIFKEFDSERNGIISWPEFVGAYMRHSERLTEISDALGTDQAIKFMFMHVHHLNTDGRLSSVFERFDVSHGNAVTKAQFAGALQGMMLKVRIG